MKFRLQRRRRPQRCLLDTSNLSRGLRQRVLGTAEVGAIQLTNPTLCCQRTLTQALCLPWPTPTQDGYRMPHQPPDYSDLYSKYSAYKRHSQPM
ncbi:hypothetical protein SprV_0100270100 [Sparganum proliferum]